MCVHMTKSMVMCSTPGLGSIELPDHMSRLTSLRRLILSGWCYSSLPGVVGRLSQIQELDFRSVVWCGAGEPSTTPLHHRELFQLFDQLIIEHVFGMHCCETSARLGLCPVWPFPPAILILCGRLTHTLLHLGVVFASVAGPDFLLLLAASIRFHLCHLISNAGTTWRFSSSTAVSFR